ncbi:MAG: transposase, partial [Actinomycetota bacterium]|nr:transposase [Actinomycetota bacterium]
MAQQEFSMWKIADRLQTEADAYLMLEELRWGGAPNACPKCGGMDRCSFLQPQDGSTGRKTRTGRNTQRRVWFCGHCRKQFSVLTDTVFHGTGIPIRKWLLVMFEMCASKNSISAWEVSRKYEVTNETAWHMLHRLREGMRMEPVAGLLGGAVQVDESWIGGNPKNRHASDPREIARKPRAQRGVGASDKQP